MSTPPLVIIGPSGAGKSTLVERLLHDTPQLQLVKTVTTRPPRSADDQSHDFVDQATYDTMRERGAFIGAGHVFGYDYGLPKLPDADQPVVVLLRAPFVATFQTKYPDAVVVEVEAPVPVLLKRLETRGDSDRADPAILDAEMQAGRQLADVVIDTNQPIKTCLAQLQSAWQI